MPAELPVALADFTEHRNAGGTDIMLNTRPEFGDARRDLFLLLCVPRPTHVGYKDRVLITGEHEAHAQRVCSGFMEVSDHRVTERRSIHHPRGRDTTRPTAVGTRVLSGPSREVTGRALNNALLY